MSDVRREAKERSRSQEKEQSIRSSKAYRTLSPDQKVLLSIYHAGQMKGNPSTNIQALTALTGMSKTTLYKYLGELEDLDYIENRMVKVKKDKEARGSKWILEIRFANEIARDYAQHLSEIVAEQA